MIRFLLARLVIVGYMLRHFAEQAWRRWRAWRYGEVRDNAAAFLRNFEAEALVPLLGHEEAAAGATHRCIRCGLCDNVCPASPTVRGAPFPGPSLIASTHARSLPDARFTRDYSAAFDACGNCVACVDVCPTGVPIRRIVAQAKRLASV